MQSRIYAMEKIREKLTDSMQTEEWLSQETGIAYGLVQQYFEGTRLPGQKILKIMALALDLTKEVYETRGRKTERVQLNSDQLSAIEKAVLAKGFSQIEIAERLGVSQSASSNYLHNKPKAGIPIDFLRGLYNLIGDTSGLPDLQQKSVNPEERGHVWQALFDSYTSPLYNAFRNAPDPKKMEIISGLSALVEKHYSEATK